MCVYVVVVCVIIRVCVCVCHYRVCVCVCVCVVRVIIGGGGGGVITGCVCVECVRFAVHYIHSTFTLLFILSAQYYAFVAVHTVKRHKLVISFGASHYININIILSLITSEQ